MNKIEQVREAIEACIDRLPDIPSYQKCKAALAILKDMDGQGPVAWMYKGGDSRYPAYLTLEKDIAEEDADDPSSIIPLYAHPSPSAPVVPVPQVRTWTEEEVLAMVRGMLGEVMYSHVTDSIMRSHEVQSVQTTSIIAIAAKHGLTL
jgi:hypothetical protein